MKSLFDLTPATETWVPAKSAIRLAVVGAILFGLLIYALLPQGIVALNDDFGYLRSVVATLQHGRPWTDDWLEPWGAGLTTLSAALFIVSRSFYFATYGLLAGLAGLSFFLAVRLLMDRGWSSIRATLLVLLGLTFPTMLWKEVQFTGMALYLPCLLGALWAAERRRWGCFFIAWLLAFSTRQSALAWGVMPVAAMGEDWMRTKRLALRQWLVPTLVVATGTALFWMLAAVMNKTLAQRLVTDWMWTKWNPSQAWRAFLVGSAVLLVTAGWATLIGGNFAAGVQPVWRRIVSGVGLLMGIGLLGVNARDHVAVEFDMFDSRWGSAAITLLAITGVIGIVIGRFACRLLPLSAACAALAVLSFRSTIWDYYLLEVGLFGFMAMGRDSIAKAAHPAVRWVWALPAGALALFQCGALLQTKSTLDRTHAMFVLGSRAIEEGRIPPSHASFLPFGLMAWYYFPAYAQRMEPTDTDLADFGRYLEQDTVLSAWRYSRRLRSLPGHGEGLPEDRRTEIVRGKFNYCWFYGVEVVLLAGPPEKTRPAKYPYPVGYRPPAFPVDDAGWRAVIAGETKLAVP